MADPLSSRDMLTPAVEELKDENRIEPVKILRRSGRSKKGWIDVELPGGISPESLTGHWICIPKSELGKRKGELYYFQIVGLQVKTEPEGDVCGVVENVFETAAHGVASVRTPDGREILVPLVDEWVTFHLDQGLLIIPNFSEFDIQ